MSPTEVNRIISEHLGENDTIDFSGSVANIVPVATRICQEKRSYWSLRMRDIGFTAKITDAYGTPMATYFGSESFALAHCIAELIGLTRSGHK